MREAVRQLPRLWQLHGELPLAAALQGTKQAPAMAHLSTPVSSGQPPSIKQPSGHTAIPLDRDYMSLGTGEPMRPSILPVSQIGRHCSCSLQCAGALPRRLLRKGIQGKSCIHMICHSLKISTIHSISPQQKALKTWNRWARVPRPCWAIRIFRAYGHSGKRKPCDAGSSAPSRWLHEDKVALQLAAEKRAAVVMADGAFAELAQTAVQGFAAGWEIPVTISPSSGYVNHSARSHQCLSGLRKALYVVSTGNLPMSSLPAGLSIC